MRLIKIFGLSFIPVFTKSFDELKKSLTIPRFFILNLSINPPIVDILCDIIVGSFSIIVLNNSL